MADLMKQLQKTDFTLWFGMNAIHVWDTRKSRKEEINFEERNQEHIPYLPAFSEVWEKPEHYQKELGRILGNTAFHRPRIVAALPEDASAIEKKALEDYIYLAAKGRLDRRGIWVFSQSMLLNQPTENFVAVTESCRCFCIALVKSGSVTKRLFADIQEISAAVFSQNIESFCEENGCAGIPVYYPEMEAERIPPGIGTPVSFQDIVKI